MLLEPLLEPLPDQDWRATHCSACSPQDCARCPTRADQSSVPERGPPCPVQFSRRLRATITAMMPTISSGQNGEPQENIQPIEIISRIAKPTASTGGTDERPRPISDSAADVSSPSAGNRSQPSR